MKHQLRTLFICLLTLVGVQASSQIVMEYLTPEEAVEALLGDGVEAENVSFIGNPDIQIGFMTGAEGTIFPLNEGVVLSCGDAENLENDTGADLPFGTGVSGDDDLLDVANSVPELIGQGFTVSSVNDLAVLEFDFIPAGDTLSFNYSFGSDEYLEWVNSTFNDIFAFFLSGPGITGPYDAPVEFPDGAINIAEVPNSDPQLPITVSSVNDQLNTEYYIDNFANVDINIDGFTVSLTAEFPVQCGETYHIKLAIADGTDSALESIVVLEAGSFASNAVFISAEASIDDAPVFLGDSVLVEGCNVAQFQLGRPLANTTDTVLYELSGSAVELLDYSDILDTLIFDSGVFVIDIPIQAFDDGIEEDWEDLTMIYTFLNECGDTITTEATLWIADYIEPILTIEDVTSLCPGTDIAIGVEIDQGYQPFTYDWNTGDSTQVIIVDPLETTTYTVVATDVCGDEFEMDGTVTVVPPPPIILDADNVTVVCPGDNVTISVDAEGGDDPYTYTWEGTEGGSSFDVDPETTTTYTVVVGDQCAQEESIDITVTVPTYPDVEGTATDGYSYCPGTEVPLDATADGGLAPYTFEWSADGTVVANGQNVVVEPDETTDYTLTITDFCGETVDVITNIIVEEWSSTILVEADTLCSGSQGTFDPIEGGTGVYTFILDSVPDIYIDFIDDLGSYNTEFIGQDITFPVWIEDDCGNNVETSITLWYCDTNIPNVFSPNGDGTNETFFIAGVDRFPGSTLKVYNRWGNLVYERPNYRNQWSGDGLADGIYYYVFERSDNINFTGTVTMLR